MTKPEEKPEHSAAEFLVVAAAEAIANARDVVAVMVVVAFAPRDGTNDATVILKPWGGSVIGQAQLLRDLADKLERTACGEVEASRTVQ